MPHFRHIAVALCLLGIIGCHETHSVPAEVETFRNATKADLSLGILSVLPGQDGFPLVVVNLRSLTEDEIIVTYSPHTVAIHCGPFIAYGPPVTFGIRREILDAFGYMDFPPPRTGWIHRSEDGRLELILPKHLPPGHYDFWATFFMPGPQGGTLETPHQIYTPPSPTTFRVDSPPNSGASR